METRYRGMTAQWMIPFTQRNSNQVKLVSVLEISCSWLHVLSVGVGWDQGSRKCSINSFTKMKKIYTCVNSSKEIMD